MATREEQLPRSVQKGPLITLTCECGARHELHYGEQWKCDGCGRRYDTRKIPLDEYRAIRRTQIRHRLFPLITGILLLIAVLDLLHRGPRLCRVDRDPVPACLVDDVRAAVVPLALPQVAEQEPARVGHQG